ncbi:MAG: hypothetical protein ACOZIN_07850 [Myxococcota bacterium]
MSHRAVAAVVTTVAAGIAFADPPCAAPPLPEKAVQDIIEKERRTRTDLPSAFKKASWTVTRRGCHYTAIESMLPPTPEASHIFTLNQHGAIVDVIIGNSPESPLRCPDKVLTELQLAQVVKSERAKRPGLHAPFPKSKTRVVRQRCLFLYFEYALPERRGDYQVFTIDPLGELIDASRSQPY